MTEHPNPATFLSTTPTDALGRAPRHDGWTPDRQRAFLSAIADGLTVERACRLVQLTVSSAYAFRQRAAGAPFALGWRAATLLARDRVADDLLARAMDGQVTTVTRPDGSTVARHTYDNRTALALLNRLDRMVEQAPADAAAAADRHAARLVAQDWEAYLDTLERDDSPARAGLFLARRTNLAGAPEASPALEPVLALARADAFTRSGASLPEEVATADLDLARRSTWTAEQWLRAEAAGLLRVAAPVAEETSETPPLPPLILHARGPVWWDEEREEFRTHFPPPAGEEEWVDAEGRYGADGYERSLTEDEVTTIRAIDDLEDAEARAKAEVERDRWFAELKAEIAATEAAAADGGGTIEEGGAAVRSSTALGANAPVVDEGAIEPVGAAQGEACPV